MRYSRKAASHPHYRTPDRFRAAVRFKMQKRKPEIFNYQRKTAKYKVKD